MCPGTDEQAARRALGFLITAHYSELYEVANLLQLCVKSQLSLPITAGKGSSKQ